TFLDLYCHLVEIGAAIIQKILRHPGELRIRPEQVRDGNGGPIYACTRKQSRKRVRNYGTERIDRRCIPIRKRTKILSRKRAQVIVSRKMDGMVSNISHFQQKIAPELMLNV